MFTEVSFPSTLPGTELDRFLERGWFRMGQAMFTSRVVYFAESMQPVLWLRLPLEGHSFAKSNRAVRRKVEKRFDVSILPANVGEVHEALYRRYLTVVTGERAASVHELLYTGPPNDLFNSWEVRVMDGDRLVAFSLFDLGERSVQSILGVYDPDYRKYGLGFYSMLAEVDHAISLGCDYYYPGYHMPLVDSMVYKLRLGALEFFDPNRRCWRPKAAMDEVPLVHTTAEAWLDRICSTLDSAGIVHWRESYRWFELPSWNPDLEDLLSNPWPVVVPSGTGTRNFMAVTWEPSSENYCLLACRIGGLSDSAERVVDGVIIVDEFLRESSDPREILASIEENRLVWPGAEM